MIGVAAGRPREVHYKSKRRRLQGLKINFV